MMKSITIQLDPEQLAALDAVATGSGGNAVALAGWIVSEWIGRLPVQQTPPASLAVAHKRLAMLQAFWKARCSGSGSVAAFQSAAAFGRSQDFRFGRSALYEWERRWRKSGVAGLVDNRPRSNRLQSTIESPFTVRVKELFRAAGGKRAIECYRQAAREFARQRTKLPSYRSIARHLMGTRRAT